MNRISTLIIIFILAVSCVSVAQNKVGSVAADFLTIPVGARAAGMGNAMVATADDVTAAYWNTGGLARLKTSEFNATYADWLAPGTSINWVGVVIKLSPDDAFAVSFSSLDYGEEEITTAQFPNGTGAKWDAMDLVVGLSYARNLTDRFSIGGTAKYIQSRIYHESATAFAMDIGLLFNTQLDGLRIGMNIANFGTEMKLEGKDLQQPVDIDPANAGNNSNIVANLETDSWALPLNFTVGVAYDVLNDNYWKWTVATDAVYPYNTTSHLNVGTEVIWNSILTARLGYNSLFEESAEEGFTAGAGVKYDFGGVELKFDYAYSDFGIFGEISRFSFAIGF